MPVLRALTCLLLTASPVLANTIECGGNSFSHGGVDTGRPIEIRRGLIEARPDSLCADLLEYLPQAIESFSVTIDPRAAPEAPRAPGFPSGNEGIRPQRR